MSKRLTYEVGASRHPLLMADPIARDVLWWMADAAQERNDCRIILAVDKLAEAMDRPFAAVRKAQERMQKAGLLVEDGRGDYNKRVRVMRINEQELNPRNRVITHEVSPRNDSESAAINLPSSCPDLALILPQPCPDAALILPQPCPDLALYAGARFEREQEQEQEQEPHECAGTPAPEHAEGNGEAKPVEKVEKPYTLPAHPVADAMLAQLNASAGMERALVAARKPPIPVPLPLPIEPAPVVEAEQAPKMSPGDARVAAAIEEAWALIAPKGQTAATLTNWRARLRSRLTAKGVSAEAVADRLEAVKRAWAYINTNGWHIAEKRNGPGHFFGVTLRSDEGLDKTASSKAEPVRGKSTTVARPWSAAGLPTAADVVADFDAEAEAREIARLEADAEAQRARIAAVAPKPAPIEAIPAPVVDKPADPERIKAAFGEMTGMLGSFGMGRGARPVAHNARNGAGVGMGKGEA